MSASIGVCTMDGDRKTGPQSPAPLACGSLAVWGGGVTSSPTPWPRCFLWDVSNYDPGRDVESPTAVRPPRTAVQNNTHLLSCGFRGSESGQQRSGALCLQPPKAAVEPSPGQRALPQLVDLFQALVGSAGFGASQL